MTACKSSGLSKPTAGCDCEYCAPAGFVPYVVETASQRAWRRRNPAEASDSDYIAAQLNKTWNEALAAKRAQR